MQRGSDGKIDKLDGPNLGVMGMTTTKKKATRKKSTAATATEKKKTTAPKESAKAKSKDDRSDHRIPIQLLVDYRADGHYLFDFCRDLGAGGVFIQTEQPLPQGSHVDLTFTIPDSKETLSAKGKVIWVQAAGAQRDEASPGMGVQFENFGPEQRRILEQFVERFHGANSNGDATTQQSA